MMTWGSTKGESYHAESMEADATPRNRAGGLRGLPLHQIAGSGRIGRALEGGGI